MTLAPAPSPPPIAPERRRAMVRESVREFLVRSPAFKELDAAKRVELAWAMVRVCESAAGLWEAASPAPAHPPTARAQAIHGLPGSSVANVADTTKNIIKAISFPRFVSELINGVFKAMLECNTSQLEAYAALLQNVATSTEGFAENNLSVDGARQWLAERFPESYELVADESSAEPAAEGSAPAARRIRVRDGGQEPSEEAFRAALGLDAGEQVPSGDPEESMLPLVRRFLARQKQQVLASMLILGMQRIVIDAGRIDASMRFHNDATSAIYGSAGTRFDMGYGASAKAGGNISGFTAEAGAQMNMSFVSTADVQTTEETNAAVDMGSAVSIHFRTDQIPLDHIASAQRVQLIKANTINPLAASVVTPTARPDAVERQKSISERRKSVPQPTPKLSDGSTSQSPQAQSPQAGNTSP